MAMGVFLVSGIDRGICVSVRDLLLLSDPHERRTADQHLLWLHGHVVLWSGTRLWGCWLLGNEILRPSHLPRDSRGLKQS